LIALPQVEETFEGGIVKAEKTIHEEKILTVVGLVLDMGEQAYADKDRFPNGPWCKVGDYVLFRANPGTRFRVSGVEYRIMNDDSIEAVVADPRGVTRA
jgi:co-chaperonin GroES (HSP10)